MRIDGEYVSIHIDVGSLSVSPKSRALSLGCEYIRVVVPRGTAPALELDAIPAVRAAADAAASLGGKKKLASFCCAVTPAEASRVLQLYEAHVQQYARTPDMESRGPGGVSMQRWKPIASLTGWRDNGLALLAVRGHKSGSASSACAPETLEAFVVRNVRSADADAKLMNQPQVKVSDIMDRSERGASLGSGSAAAALRDWASAKAFFLIVRVMPHQLSSSGLIIDDESLRQASVVIEGASAARLHPHGDAMPHLFLGDEIEKQIDSVLRKEGRRF
jgi:hypothetical protein